MRDSYAVAQLLRVNAPVVTRAKDVAPLVRAKSRSGAPRDGRWKLAVNAVVEPDL